MQTASIIFLDAPVGTGFSYSTTQEGWPSSDSKSAEQSYQFLRKVLHKTHALSRKILTFFHKNIHLCFWGMMQWLDEHPQYLPVQLFIGGDSYSGITVPLVTKKVIDGNIVS